jgi:hypothetical protein
MTDRREGRIEFRASHAEQAIELDDDALEGRGDAEEDLDLIERVRNELEIEESVSDVTIAASLAQIGGRADMRGRWLAAFGSPLGKHLALRGSDLNTALNTLLALAPRLQA